MRLSEQMKQVRPSPLVGVMKRVAELRARGKDVVSLDVGEPDAPTPDFVQLAAIEAILQGRTRYGPVDGAPELKRAIADAYKNDRALEFEPSQIIVTNGSKQAVFNAIVTTVSADERVIVPAPYWMSYPDMVRLAGATPQVIATKAEDGFKITVSALAAALEDGARALLLNSPNNPSGAVYQREELAALADVVRKFPDVVIICDDIYESITFDGARHVTMLEVAPDLSDQIIIVSGLSKSFSMTGWRVGYAIAPAPVIRAMAAAQSQQTNHPCSISQWAAAAALRDDHGILEARRRTYQAQRDLLARSLAAAPGLRFRPSEGSFYCWVDCTALIGGRAASGEIITDDLALVSHFLDAGVSVMPGSVSGCEGYVRLSFATSEALIVEAAARLAAACRAVSAA